MTNLESILKSRNITLPRNVHPVKGMVSLVAMYGCENWTIKKAECRGVDAFELWSWRRLLTVPCTPKSSNQSILKQISPEYSLEGLMLRLKLQYFGHLMGRIGSFEKTVMPRKVGSGQSRRDDREWDSWIASLTQWRWVRITLRVSDRQGGLAWCNPWGRRVVPNYTTELNWMYIYIQIH